MAAALAAAGAGVAVTARTEVELAVLPGMIDRRQGRVVNVASTAGTVPRKYFSAYGVSKTALIRLTETLALETAEHGIGVFAIHPGRVLTPMNQALLQSPDAKRWLPGVMQAVEVGRIPFRRADDAAHLVVAPASGRGDPLSGRYLDVETDDLDALLARIDDVRQHSPLTLRLAR
jgi:NAD(P)-dependent dehydrogenase (short-subunit alcohol dehydrogenase family)